MYQGNAALSLEPWWGKPAANDELASDREHYNYFRYYDPSTGRYLTSDPIGLNGGLNTYGYVEGNPIRNIDPLGLESSTTRGLPRAPTPFDVFIHGTPANDAFVDSTSKAFSEIGDILDDLLGPLDAPDEKDDTTTHDECIEMCLPLLGIGDNGDAFHKCVADCVRDNQCL